MSETSIEPQSIAADNETPREPVVTLADILALNAARKALARIEDRVQTYDEPLATTRSGGRLAEAADVGSDAIFRVLNVASSYCHIDIPHHLLHAHEDEEQS